MLWPIRWTRTPHPILTGALVHMLRRLWQMCTKADHAETCCYDPRFDQRTDGALDTNSYDTADYSDPGVQPITAFRGAISSREIGEGGRAHSNQLVAECDVTVNAGGDARSPTTTSIGDTPLQGGSATYWTQMATAYDRLNSGCP